MFNFQAIQKPIISFPLYTPTLPCFANIGQILKFQFRFEVVILFFYWEI